MLFGLAVVHRGMQSGSIHGNGDLSVVEQLIGSGLERMKLFYHPGGGFSLWEHGGKKLDLRAGSAHGQKEFVSTYVLKNLLPFKDLTFDFARTMLRDTSALLAREGLKENRILALDPGFRAPLESVEDAVALYFAGFERDRCLSHLRERHEATPEGVRWKGGSSWGGDLEATCDALRVMADANDPLFQPGFRYISDKIVDGRLYSTADTRALVELFAFLKSQDSREAEIDGTRVALSGHLSGHRVKALADGLMVRVDEEREVNHLDVPANFRGELATSATRLRRGEKLTVTVKPLESTTCPLARLFLPGCLALLSGGANAQTAYLPVKDKELAVTAVAVRRGQGPLQAMLHDMYDAAKVGVLPPISITVD